jgi:non-heme chloroperoxidase
MPLVVVVRQPRCFLDNFYNVDEYGGTRISDQAWQNSFIVAVSASAYAAHACVDTWLTDFRGDLPEDRRPDAARPRRRGPDPALRGHRQAAAGPDREAAIRHRRRRPHNIARTHPDEVNRTLLDFVND